MERCPDCGEWKPYEEFPRNRCQPDGRHTDCKPCHNARGRESKDRLYGGNRHYHLKRRYGIGADEFDRMVAEQGGVCAVCARPEPEHVDHDHSTQAVRGILCFNCNGGSRQFGDDGDRLVAAAHYLDRADVVPEHARELHELARVRARKLVTGRS